MADQLELEIAAQALHSPRGTTCRNTVQLVATKATGGGYAAHARSCSTSAGAVQLPVACSSAYSARSIALRFISKPLLRAWEGMAPFHPPAFADRLGVLGVAAS